MAATVVAGRPYNDYADNWCGLFELFVSVSGLKLRINIPDTVIIKDGRMVGWFYTNRDGVICRCALHEISPATIFQKLVGSATLDEEFNPYAYVALCHFESGISRPLKQQELQHLLADLVGPYEGAKGPVDANADVPYCIQAYVIPHRDLRYLATYGGAEQATCTVFGRRYSARYTHVSDGPLPDRLVYHQEETDPVAPTSEELIVESQLVALGLLEPRLKPGDAALMGMGGGGSEGSEASVGPGSAAASDAMIPASKSAKNEMTKQIQALVSFVERSHGLRIQGLVAEFIQAHSQVFVLVAIHAVQWDGRSSRGRLGTFTERWQDYTAGLGPAPAAQPSSRPGSALHPPLLLSHDAPALTMTDRRGAAAAAGFLSHRDGADAGAWAHRASIGRVPTTNPALNQLLDVSAARPGSAPAQIAQRFRPPYPRGAGAPGSPRGPASARRARGDAPGTDSYALFTPRDMLSTDTIAGSLVLEVEILKERLQRQADIAVRAETALTQLALSSQTTQQGLVRQLHEAKAQAEAAETARANVAGEYERLRAERVQFTTRITELEREAAEAKASLQADRATLANTVRTAADKEESLEDMCNRLRADNEQLQIQNQQMSRRLEEEMEVVEAAKNQLYDYRQIVAQLQNQLRRGKNKPVAGTVSPPVNASIGSFSGLAGGFSSGGALHTPGVSNGGALQHGQSHRMSQSNGLTDFELPSDQGAAAGNGDLSLSKAAMGSVKAQLKRPGNSPLRPPSGTGQGIASGRVLDKSVTAPPRRMTIDGVHSISNSGAAEQETASSSRRASCSGGGYPTAPLPPRPAARPPSATAPATASPPSPRSAGLLRFAATNAAAAHSAPMVPLPTDALTPTLLSPAAASVLFAPSTDPISALIHEMRMARKHGVGDGNPFLIAITNRNNICDDSKETAAKESTGSRLAQSNHKREIVTMISKKEKVVNPWKPNYDNMHLNDLFIMTGELSERMAETMVHTINLLKSLESELLEIYSYYASLGQVQYVEEKLMMVHSQFLKMAKCTGLGHDTQSLDQIDDAFESASERVSCDVRTRKVFITFWEFPEAVCRLAAARYDWRPPEHPDEADDDIEQPESLRTVELANISELPTANHYGVGPTAKISSKEAEKQIVREPPKSGRPRSAAPIKRPDPDEGCVVTAVSELGPQPPDVVLYTIIKTYLLKDFLPNVKRNKGSSSKLSKAKLGTRTVPTDVWA